MQESNTGLSIKQGSMKRDKPGPLCKSIVQFVAFAVIA